jgi:hypothetical protein
MSAAIYVCNDTAGSRLGAVVIGLVQHGPVD